MANAPALLRGYLDLNRAMKRRHLDRRIRERIALAVHEWLECDYCLAAHTRGARARPQRRLERIAHEILAQAAETDRGSWLAGPPGCPHACGILHDVATASRP